MPSGGPSWAIGVMISVANNGPRRNIYREARHSTANLCPPVSGVGNVFLRFWPGHHRGLSLRSNLQDSADPRFTRSPSAVVGACIGVVSGFKFPEIAARKERIDMLRLLQLRLTSQGESGNTIDADEVRRIEEMMWQFVESMLKR